MQWFFRATRRLDKLGIWYGGYAMLTGIVGWFAKEASWLPPMNWADAALLGLFGAAGLMLVICAGLALYRMFNPLASRTAAPASVDLATTIDNSEVAAMIEARMKGLAKPSDLHAHDVKLAEISDRIKFVRDLAEGGHGAFEARLEKIEEAVKQVLAFAEQRTQSLKEQIENVDLGFAAIINREWHQRLFAELEKDFAAVAAPVNADLGLIDGDGWLESLKSWRGKLDQWLVIADFYAMDTAEKVLAIPDNLYDGNWNFNEKMMTANQVHRFKEASIWWMSAQAAKRRVDRCLAAAAFEVPSKKGRLESPPRPSANR